MKTYIITVERLYTSDFGDPECSRVIKTGIIVAPSQWDAMKLAAKTIKKVAVDRYGFYTPNTVTNFFKRGAIITRQYEGYPDYLTYGVRAELHPLEKDENNSPILWAKMK